MIKKLILKYRCTSCGGIINIERIIEIDEFLKKIDIIKPKRCACGRISYSVLLDLNILNFEDDRKNL